jgi:type I restriction enzyme S subunit
MSELPCGWVEAAFDEINSFSSKTIDPSMYPNELFELYSVPIFPTGRPELVTGAEIGSTKQIVGPGDVLVCKINPRINRVWIVGAATGKRQIASSEWIVMRAKQHEPRFLKHYFSSAGFRELLCTDLTGVGGSLTRAQPKRVATFDIPIAPLPEQRRIADKLDTLLARVEATRARLDRIPELLKRFRQSVLAAATSGQLTEDWRTEMDVSSIWIDQQPQDLKSLVDLDLGYAFKSAEYESKGIRLLRGDNIEPRSLRWRDAKYYPQSKLTDLKHLMLRKGDIVLAMDRPIISSGLKIARVSEMDLPAILVQRVCRFRPVSILKNDYLFLLLQSGEFISHLKSHQNGSGVPHISGGQIQSFRVNIPSLEEQEEIVRRVECLFALIDRLEARYQTASDQVGKLTPALLSKAFRGELVPQDPKDEPAEQLLARIREVRDAAPATSKRGRKNS